MSEQMASALGGGPALGVAPGMERPGAGPERIEVLILDDSEFDVRHLEREFARTNLPVHVTRAATLQEYSAALAERLYDIVFIDYILPEGDGLEATQMLRGSGLNATAPAVMITNDTRFDVAVAAIRNGCQDYLAKSGLAADGLRDVVLRAIRDPGPRVSPTQAPVPRDDMLNIIREVLREEMAASRSGVDDGLLIRTLAAHGVIPAGLDNTDWDDLLEDDTQTFVFRPQ